VPRVLLISDLHETFKLMLEQVNTFGGGTIGME
jgi:hypothetical protein